MQALCQAELTLGHQYVGVYHRARARGRLLSAVGHVRCCVTLTTSSKDSKGPSTLMSVTRVHTDCSYQSADAAAHIEDS